MLRSRHNLPLQSLTSSLRSLTFSDKLAPIFLEAGFAVSSDMQAGRRLLDLGLEVSGFFNYLARFDLDALEASFTGAGLDKPPSGASFPTAYTMDVSIYTLCNYSADAGWCASPLGGSKWTTTHPDYPGQRFFVENASVTARPSSVRSVSTFSFEPGRSDVALMDTASGFQLSASSWPGPLGLAWSNCVEGAGSSDSVFSYIERAGIAPVAVSGGASVLGAPARHFTFTASTGLLIDYFDLRAAPHPPVRVAITYPGAAPTVMDVSSFVDESALSVQTVAWPGSDMPSPLSCPSAATFPAGAARYPNAPPLGAVTSMIPPVASSWDTSTPRASARRLHEQKRRILPTGGSFPSPPPSPPPNPSPRPPMPPPPFPPPPCANSSTAVYNCCSNNAPYSCTRVSVVYCNNVSSVTLSNSTNVTYTSAANYPPPPSPAAGRRSLLQTTAPLLFGTLAASYNLNDDTFVVPPSTVNVNLGWSYWPSDAQAQCLGYMTLAECQTVAANFGGHGDGTVDLSPDVGTMALSYLSNNGASNNTYIGLTGGATTTVVPPLPGFPFLTSQFPVMTGTGYLARIWYFLKGPYKQTLFCWIHVNIALPCAGGSTSCGSINFDLVNQNSFLVLLSPPVPGAIAAPPPPNGFFQFLGCRKNAILPIGIGWYNSMSDCLNKGMELGLATMSGGVCGNSDLNCRSCWGCSYAQVASGGCYLGLNATGCDAMGAVTGTGMNLVTIYSFMFTDPSPPPLPSPLSPPPFPPLSPFTQSSSSATGWKFTNTYWWPWSNRGDGSRADLTTMDGPAFVNLNNHWRCGTTTAVGPCDNNVATNTDGFTAVAGTVQQQCQIMAGLLGFDTVMLWNYHYRPNCGAYATDCYACSGCGYYVGGVVPNALAATADVRGANSLTNSTGGQQSVMQVYRLYPPQPPPPPAPPTPPSPPQNYYVCPPYSARSTSSAMSNTPYCRVTLTAGTTYSFTMCVPGSAASGDTYLRLLGPTGSMVAQDDDSCGSFRSVITYTAPVGGIYSLAEGCYSSVSCSGTVVISPSVSPA
jgi:hypothetical protein